VNRTDSMQPNEKRECPAARAAGVAECHLARAARVV